jgi:NAD(P)-dependent dehydrogenase (short-subunit alcohol dehydrogenase family)
MVNILANQTVVIIGGTSGIGFGVAKHILESTKANVVVASRTPERVNKSQTQLAEIGGSNRVKGYILDLSDQTKLEAELKAFFNKVGSFNHLVFTAGDSFSFLDIEHYTREVAEKVWNIRYYGLLECLKQGLSQMPKSRESSITFTSSTLSQRPTQGWVLLGTGLSGALDAMARGLAFDLNPIRVNAVSPGIIDTELWHWLAEEPRKALFADYSQKFLTKSVGTADEIAEAYGFFIRCTYVTGQILTVDGGSVLV